MSLSSFTVHHLSCFISDANVVHRELKSENLRQPLCAEQKTSSSGSNAHRENLYPWNTHRQTHQTQMTYNLPCNVPNTFVWGDKVDFFKGGYCKEDGAMQIGTLSTPWVSSWPKHVKTSTIHWKAVSLQVIHSLTEILSNVLCKKLHVTENSKNNPLPLGSFRPDYVTPHATA